jgi:hypothetical protein
MNALQQAKMRSAPFWHGATARNEVRHCKRDRDPRMPKQIVEHDHAHERGRGDIAPAGVRIPATP